MQRLVALFCCAMTLSVVVLVANSRGEEEKVPLDKAPKAVLDAVKAHFQGAQLSEASKETEDGKLIYEVSIKHKGQNIDVTVTPQGEIVLIEKEISFKDLPQPAAKALEAKYPKADYKIVEEIIKVENKREKLEHYEALLTTADKKTVEVEVSGEGKILHEENKDAEKDEK